MSGTGLPILLSRNYVLASKNASRLHMKDFAQIRLAHVHKLQQQPGELYRLPITSQYLPHRHICTSTLPNSVKLFKGLCAIKHPNNCQKNCKLLMFSHMSVMCSHGSRPCSSCCISTSPSSSLKRVPNSNNTRIISTVHPIHGGVRSLCSKPESPTTDSKETKASHETQGTEVTTNLEGIPDEVPVVIKLKNRPTKDGKVEASAVKDAKSDGTQAKIEPEVKPYRLRRKKVDYSKNYTENITITAWRAKSEYLLTPIQLAELRNITRRTPYDTNPNEPPLQVYLRRDVEEKAIEVWGSKEALTREKKTRKRLEYMLKDNYSLHQDEHSNILIGPQVQDKPPPSFFSSSGSHVVFSAICINAANFVFKVVAWMYSGSASMFSEAIHSAADTLNQLILAWGIHSATKSPSKDHPYGYATLTYVSSLISGVGIFCVGAGLSVYHGIMGLVHPEAIEPLYWSYVVLAGALISEGATLGIAIDAIKKGAEEKKMTFFEYVWSSRNPSVNVVFLEDAAAVVGIIVAGSCMGLTSYTGNSMYDSLGSLAVGAILASVSGFLVYTNTQALVGRSINDDQLAKINDMLYNDPVVRGVYDIKATDMGVGLVRFKAEIDFDGREVTRAYLDKQDLDMLLKSVKTVQTSEELEVFMLTHGEKAIDMLGSQVDRLEKEIKKLNPEVRHVDLEIL